MHRLFLQLLLLTFALVCSVSVVVLAQPGATQNDLTDLYSYGDDYFLEVITMPGWSGNKSRVVVAVRLTYNLISFRKSTVPGTTEDVYISTPSVHVEALALDGVIVDYGHWNDTVKTNLYSQTNSRLHLASGSVELRLRPGVYTIKYTVDDGASREPFSRSTAPFVVPDFRGGEPEVGSPIFLRSWSETAMTLAAIDGNPLFGQELRAYIPLASSSDPSNLRYEVLSVKGNVEKKESLEYETVEAGTGKIVGSAIPGALVPEGGNLVWQIERDSVPLGVYGALIEYPATYLKEGEYALLLEYSAGGQRVVDTTLFSLRWIEKPFTYANPTYAINALYPIATDEEIDGLLSVGKEDREQALLKYWKEHDPTPETVFNERMAEYYRRADYAYFNFASLSEPDGVFTDRGKIYMLFGSPTKTQRQLKPDSNPEEIWTYSNVVNREFIFRDRTESGVYQLVEYYDL